MLQHLVGGEPTYTCSGIQRRALAPLLLNTSEPLPPALATLPGPGAAPAVVNPYGEAGGQPANA